MFNNSNGGYSLSDLAAVTGNRDGFGFGGDGAWLIVLFLLFAFNGWGGMGFGGFGGGWGMMNGLGWGMMDGAFPWLLASNANNQNATNAGFDSLALGNTLSGIQSSITSGFGDTALGIAGINQNICQTGSGITAAINNGFASAEIANNARQIANMQQAFNAQTAVTAGLNGIQSDLASCCCENRLSNADLKYTIATENCADRAALSDALRDVIAANTASTQRILDQLCQDKIDAKNDTIAQLRQELLYARGQASQDVQTARLLAGQTAEVDALYNRLNTCPVPTTPVYGRTPIFTCNNGGCGCSGSYYNGLVA